MIIIRCCRQLKQQRPKIYWERTRFENKYVLYPSTVRQDQLVRSFFFFFCIKGPTSLHVALLFFHFDKAWVFTQGSQQNPPIVKCVEEIWIPSAARLRAAAKSSVSQRWRRMGAHLTSSRSISSPSRLWLPSSFVIVRVNIQVPCLVTCGTNGPIHAVQ